MFLSHYKEMLEENLFYLSFAVCKYWANTQYEVVAGKRN
jgi:hypothetical protein